MDGIVFWRENCASASVSFDHVSYSVFRIARDLFYWELIFCVFCYSYSEIGINGIVPKERALSLLCSHSGAQVALTCLKRSHGREKKLFSVRAVQ